CLEGTRSRRMRRPGSRAAWSPAAHLVEIALPADPVEIEHPSAIVLSGDRAKSEVDRGALGRQLVEPHDLLDELLVHDHVRPTHVHHDTPHYTHGRGSRRYRAEGRSVSYPVAEC